MASVLEDLAPIALSAGHTPQAATMDARLLGAAQAMRETIGTVLAPSEHAQHYQSADAAKTVLGDAEFEAACQRGMRTTDLNAALDEPSSADDTTGHVPHDGSAADQPAPAADTAPAATPPSPAPRRRRPPVQVPAQTAPPRSGRTPALLIVRALGTPVVDVG